jgi:acyl-CoA synthetase (AMP-forming)/AMP-acid ligase II
MAGFLLDAFARYEDRIALIWRGRSVRYGELRALALETAEQLRPRVERTFALTADYSPKSLALLLALLSRGAVVALVSKGFDRQKEELLGTAQVETEIAVDEEDRVAFRETGHLPSHPLLLGLRDGGLVLFSSGSAGKIKAVVHDGKKLLSKYRTPRRANVTIPFMLFDHIGGINTVLHVLCSGGTAVIAQDRSVETICSLIDEHRVQVLPSTPTFLNLLLLADRSAYDLSSLQILAYGAERMPEAALLRLRAAFPGVQLIQNYGLSEVGIMRTKSEASDSLWMKVEGVKTRVRDGMLEIESDTAMMGYLNDESPFTSDGWLKTGDRVEVKGEYLRVLGRQTDIINIGGEKVYPAEVEDLIAAMPGVIDVVVSAEPNAITGNIVKAEVQLAGDETRADFRSRMRRFLGDRLAPFKIPQKVIVTKDSLSTSRLKKKRS